MVLRPGREETGRTGQVTAGGGFDREISCWVPSWAHLPEPPPARKFMTLDSVRYFTSFFFFTFTSWLGQDRIAGWSASRAFSRASKQPDKCSDEASIDTPKESSEREAKNPPGAALIESLAGSLVWVSPASVEVSQCQREG